MYEGLLEGAYDLHVHTGPDVMKRKLDDMDMAERIQAVGMKGYGIKSHYFCTAERAKLVQKIHPNVNALGAIALNNSVGGLNPLAVEMAARDGAKIVWMPTFDASNEQEHFRSGKHDKLPFWATLQMELIEKGKTQSSIGVLENGTLKSSVLDILDIIAEYNLILATGHLGKDEIFAVVGEAVNRHINKIVITHPNFPSIRLSKEEQKQLAEMGAYMEHCFTTPHSGKTTWEAVYDEIRYVGAAHCILSTDLGQPTAPYPDEGLLTFAQNLLENGFSREEVKRMTVENTTFLAEA
ncbi:cytosolic protein [Alicyclobacillus curvatus]|jgi:stage V sporulation protein SpoVS|nr:cytosolic protein [Alicyclobacillus curvatus]